MPVDVSRSTREKWKKQDTNMRCYGSKITISGEWRDKNIYD